jgi:hypothetical protein
MDDNTLALCELSNDLAYAKIPQEKFLYYISHSLESGRKAAKEFQGCDIIKLYDEHHIHIKYLKESKERFGIMLRGSVILSQKECSVELYNTSISELAAHSKFDGGALLDYDSALRIHLAHEFYHFWEYKNGNTISMRLDTVQTLKLKFYTRNAHVKRCEEIAAHAFTKELLKLPVLPNYYDYLYLIDCGKLTQSAFETLLMRNSSLLFPTNILP